MRTYAQDDGVPWVGFETFGIHRVNGNHWVAWRHDPEQKTVTMCDSLGTVDAGHEIVATLTRFYDSIDLRMNFRFSYAHRQSDSDNCGYFALCRLLEWTTRKRPNPLELRRRLWTLIVFPTEVPKPV